MRIFKCNNCSKIHIEVGNVLLHFSNVEKLTQYLKELDFIDAEYYAMLNAGKCFSKDVFMPVTGVNIDLCFTVEEFNELRELIRNYLNPKPTINTKPIFITAHNLDIYLN